MSQPTSYNQESQFPSFYPLTLGRSPQKEDVVGKAKDFLDKLEVNIGAEEIFNAMGTQPEKTFLLYGPPGTGKSMCIQAINNYMNKEITDRFSEKASPEELKENPLSLRDFGLMTFPYDIGSHGTAYINMGSRILQTFFDTCFTVASKGKKVLIVMDEFDALGSSRKQSLNSGHAEDRKVLETIMKNLQKVHDTSNLYSVLMTNEPEICDNAVLRAGRIDERYFLDIPNGEERKKGFEKAIDNINKKASYEIISHYSLDNLVDISQGFSYADIFQSVEKSVKQKAREVYLQREESIIKPGKVSRSELEKSVKEHKENFKESKKQIGFN